MCVLFSFNCEIECVNYVKNVVEAELVILYVLLMRIIKVAIIEFYKLLFIVFF